MAIEFYMLMPVEKEKMGPQVTKKLINFLVDSGHIKFDMPVSVWEIDGIYYDEVSGYDDLEYEFKSLFDFYKKIPELNVANINFEIGLSHYGNDLDKMEEEGTLPGINLLTNELKEIMDNFCLNNSIDPVIDVFGGITFGLIEKGAEDGCGEKRGLGIYCDGNVAQYMEDAGFLTDFDKNARIYKFFEEVASTLGTDVALQFRY